MRLRTVRLFTGVICTLVIASMIISAILSHIGAVVTFGLIGTVAIIAMIIATTVVKTETSVPKEDIESLSEQLETSILQITSTEATDEDSVRQIVRIAVKLGQSMGPTNPVAKDKSTS